MLVKKRNTNYTWLNKLVSKLDYGLKYGGHPIHANKKTEVLSFLQRKRSWIGGLTAKHLDMHTAGSQTFYYTCSAAEGMTIPMIDIDCHRSGSLDGAKKFAEYLRGVFPNLYYEVSTNGNGIHAYPLLLTHNHTPSEINSFLKQFESWLLRQQDQQKFDVETIEVKGTCLVYEKNILTMGQLAKVPRGLNDRFEELKNTSVIDMDELTFDLIPSIKIPSIRNTGKTKETALPKKSCSGKLISTETIKKYLKISDSILGGEELKINENVRIKKIDMAILIAIIEHCTANKNADGSMPTKRIKNLWDALYHAGDIDRQFNSQRYRFLRLIMKAKNLLEYQDERYFYVPDQKGKAAKWGFTASFMKTLIEIKRREETSFILGNFVTVSQKGLMKALKDDFTRVLKLFERQSNDYVLKLMYA